MANMFDYINTLAELEEAYIMALKSSNMTDDEIDKDYEEKRNQLLGQMTIPTTETVFTQNKSKNIKNTPSEISMGVIPANVSAPAIEPILHNGAYSAISELDTDLSGVSGGGHFHDYIPFIKDNKLYLRSVNKRSELVDVQQNLDIEEEEGKKLELKSAFKCENYITERNVGLKGSVSVVRTLLINPTTDYIRWEIYTMWAMHDGYIEKLKFRISQ